MPALLPLQIVRVEAGAGLDKVEHRTVAGQAHSQRSAAVEAVQHLWLRCRCSSLAAAAAAVVTLHQRAAVHLPGEGARVQLLLGAIQGQRLGTAEHGGVHLLTASAAAAAADQSAVARVGGVIHIRQWKAIFKQRKVITLMMYSNCFPIRVIWLVISWWWWWCHCC